jgi:hypothetical protein
MESSGGRGWGKSPGAPQRPGRRNKNGTTADLLITFVSSTGKIFVILQLCLTLTGVVTSTIYNKIYQLTLDKFIGTCFVLSSFLSFLAIVPIG